jgi:exonuclease VII small subunit
MVSQEKLDTLFQIVNSMEQSILNLERAFKAGNSENLESAKRIVLELQKKLSEELK